MRLLFLAFLALFVGCGSPSSGGADQAADGTTQGEKGDKGDAGSVGPIGPSGPKGDVGAAGGAGAAGLTIESLYNLSSNIADLCTRYINYECSFRGGKLIKYSNGLKYVEGGIVDYSTFDITGSGVDPDQTDSDLVIADSEIYSNEAGQRFNVQLYKIHRVGGNTRKQLWLALDYDTDTVSLVFDTDDDGVQDDSDEVVEVLTKTLFF